MIKASWYLSSPPELRVARIVLGLIIAPLELLLGGREEPVHVFPWTDGSLRAPDAGGAAVVAVDVVSHPYEQVRVEIQDRFPDRLRK